MPDEPTALSLPGKSCLPRPIVVAITGASGAVYGMRLLQAFLANSIPIYLSISDSGAAVIRQELQVTVGLDGAHLFDAMLSADSLLSVPEDARWSTAIARSAAERELLTICHYRDFFTPIASGSFLTAGMVICPCSGSTLSGIAHAASQNLIQRAAEVQLKERRKLIVVPRETPLSLFQLENMQRLTQAGAVVLPASPGWYSGARSLLDLVDFVVSRILDQFGIENHAIKRWAAESGCELRRDEGTQPSGGVRAQL